MGVKFLGRMEPRSFFSRGGRYWLGWKMLDLAAEFCGPKRALVLRSMWGLTWVLKKWVDGRAALARPILWNFAPGGTEVCARTKLLKFESRRHHRATEKLLAPGKDAGIAWASLCGGAAGSESQAVRRLQTSGRDLGGAAGTAAALKNVGAEGPVAFPA